MQAVHLCWLGIYVPSNEPDSPKPPGRRERRVAERASRRRRSDAITTFARAGVSV
jgi:hypothetical protein